MQYAFYDWTREMTGAKRLVATIGFLLQAFTLALALLSSHKFHSTVLLIVPLLYTLGLCLMNGALTSEFVRKTQLEADQLAANQIQQTLNAQPPDRIPGYQLQTSYQPFRDVGGDYFDVIDLSGKRTLFVVADVSGKGMPAALLSANIQALVRIIADTEVDPQALATRINQHLVRYTPADRFATAVFVLLDRDSGELRYVNAGHNAPLLSSGGSTRFLEATGMPLGLFADAGYEAGTAVIPPGGSLLLFTDGLTDSIADPEPESRLRQILTEGAERTMSSLKLLVDAKLNDDDVTILLLRRDAEMASTMMPA